MSRRSLLDSLLAKAATLHTGRITRRFFKAVEQATVTQDRLLTEILRTHASSDFGQEHHFGQVRDYPGFAANVPIRTYADLAPYIDRVRNGEVGALFRPGERILMFALTSGTTAEPKYIPITPRVLADCRSGWNVWGLAAVLDHPGCLLRHIVQVNSPMNDHAAPSGVACGAITGLLAATQKRLVRQYYTSPLAVAGIKDSTAKYYTIMRLAIPKDVAWAVTANPSTLLLLARTADQHREKMIRDIHDGTLTAGMSIEDDIRAALAPSLNPDPSCAKRLETIVGDHGAMYPRHYWRLGFLAHWTGGTMGLYAPQFREYYGEVPSRDIGLVASEGRMSIPLADGTAAGVLEVTSQFFEFVPAAEYGTPDPTVLRSHEVRHGEEYFLLLTNHGGLYRYDIGDRVRVTGQVGQAPVIEFMSRDAHTSSLAGEKLTEDQVVMAMQRVCGGRESVVDFILAPRWAQVPRYRLYVEAPAVRTVQDAAGRLDAALSEISVEYASKRQTLRLEAVELAELPPGFLAERDRGLRRQRSQTSEQFKHQYLLPKPGLDADLAEKRVDATFSWAPGAPQVDK
jgi:hypothetical protein